MTILLTGWTGNVGSLVLPELRRRWPQARIVGISRNGDARAAVDTGDFVAETASLDDPAAVAAAVEKQGPIDLLIHIANIHYTPLMLEVALRAGAKRAILIHTTGIYSRYRDYGERYREIDRAAQETTPASLRWTILRPTMIYGNERDKNMHRLILSVARWPVFPIFGSGTMTLQPVHAEDVAAAIVTCLENPGTENRAYDLSGGSVMAYRDIVRFVARALGKRRWLISLPPGAVIAGVRLIEKLGRRSPVSIEQIQRLQEDKAYPHAEASADWGYAPRTLEQGLLQEIARLRSIGLLRAGK